MVPAEAARYQLSSNAFNLLMAFDCLLLKGLLTYLLTLLNGTSLCPMQKFEIRYRM